MRLTRGGVVALVTELKGWPLPDDDATVSGCRAHFSAALHVTLERPSNFEQV